MHEMTPAEIVVLMAICRQTFGWHKSEEVITLSELQRMTGMSRPTVIAGIEAAERHELLERTNLTKQSQSYRLLVVSDYQQPVKNLDRSNNFTGNQTLPDAVKELDRSPVKNLDPYLLKKDLKKLKENVGREPPPTTFLESGNDDGETDFDPVEALIEIDFTPVQAVDAQTAYRAAEVPLDAAEVARIAQYIANPPARIQKPAGYLASKWRFGKVEPLVPPPIKHSPAWDNETQRFEPQPADIPQSVIDQARQMRAELDKQQDQGVGMIDQAAVAALKARLSSPLRKTADVTTPPASFWRSS